MKITELFVSSIYKLLPPLLHYSYYTSSVLHNITQPITQPLAKTHSFFLFIYENVLMFSLEIFNVHVN